MTFRVPFALMLLLAMVGLVAAAPAQASDAQLRQVVKQQEAKLKPVLEEFTKAADKAETPEDLKALSEITGRVSEGVAAYKKALAPVKGSTAKGKKGKAKLRTALTSYNTAFKGFKTFLDDATAGASKSELEASEKKFEKAFDRAEKQEDQALALLGIESDD